MKDFDPAQVKLGTQVIVKQFQGVQVPARYLAMLEDGRHAVEMVAVSGVHFVNVLDEGDIFMPPTKRTVYMNIMKGGPAAWFISAYAADAAQHTHPVIARAVPIEIEE